MHLIGILAGLLALALSASSSLRAFAGGAAEYFTALGLTAVYNCGYRFQHLPIIKASCKVAGSLDPYDVPLHEFLVQRFPLGTGPQRVSATAVVFRHVRAAEPEILLVQSKAWLGMGGKWETTGGGVDFVPRETVLRAAERELEQEAGVKLASIDAYVGQYTFQVPWMLWTKDNLKIVFLGSVKGGDGGVQNIILSRMEHQAFCWATKAQLEKMTLHKGDRVPVPMKGLQAMPQDNQWAQMPYISEEDKKLALNAFDVLKKQELGEGRQNGTFH
jgi:8-oxo-dGTP pyrophosphatase MutT (NUDIX family)